MTVHCIRVIETPKKIKLTDSCDFLSNKIEMIKPEMLNILYTLDIKRNTFFQHLFHRKQYRTKQSSNDNF